MTAWIAESATCAPARERLRAWPPEDSSEWRTGENARLAEAIRRQREPGAWCHAPEGALAPLIDPERVDPLDGPALRDVLGWLESARLTRECWGDDDRARHPRLAATVDAIPGLEPLRAAIAHAIEPDGRVSDAASPALARVRAGLVHGERELERRLERWARGHGENAYVTRHADRFVALVPAAGFERRLGIVHDVSNSGQSLFVEPLDACEANNHLLELRAAAAEEERRVLRRLADAVLECSHMLATLEDRLAHLDTLRARARWAAELDAVAIEPGGDRLRLDRARHPLLVRARGADVVPLDLQLATDRRVLLVSGPNMGGKTVLLKTVGLAAALAHAALPVPAGEGSAIPELDALEVDLGDGQSVEQGLSTFAAHLAALRVMAEQAGPRALLLADEVGAGTDPEEGAALGRALLERFAASGAWGVLTTHFGTLKRAAGEVEGVASGSLEFDTATLTSRYRFVPDVPGASHAIAVAERLGFPADVLARARALTPESAAQVERLIEDLHATRTRLETERERLAAAAAAAEAAEAGAREIGEEARRTLARTRDRLTRESEALLAQTRELWQTVQREARRAHRTRESADAVRARIEVTDREVERVQKQADEALAAAGGTPRNQPLEAVEVGQRVRVLDLGVEAEVASPPDAEGRVQLRRGIWSIQSHVSRLTTPDTPSDGHGATPRGARTPAATWEAAETPGLEMDLRGKEVDEAIVLLDQALDRAVLAGLGELRVIHGIGRGVLRAAVEKHLRGHPQVASQRLGQVGEGGRGVTLVRIR